eukprot:4304621-Pyramimonas_sp.AAC.1
MQACHQNRNGTSLTWHRHCYCNPLQNLLDTSTTHLAPTGRSLPRGRICPYTSKPEALRLYHHAERSSSDSFRHVEDPPDALPRESRLAK